MGAVLTVLFVAALWAAAVAFASDSRDGRDWSRSDAGDRSRRLGD
jgi:hypothetical protein